jgi:hypothetical protein
MDGALGEPLNELEGVAEQVTTQLLETMSTGVIPTVSREWSAPPPRLEMSVLCARRSPSCRDCR